MAGHYGFSHKCAERKIDITSCMKSINQSDFTESQVATIWDFYVVHCLNGDTPQARSFADYAWNETQSKTDGLPALEQELATAAGFSKFCMVCSKSLKETLAEMDLSKSHICVVHPRAAMLRTFNVNVDENEICEITKKEGRLSCLFRHIRNALAHANTYWPDDEHVVLRDLDGSKVTATLVLRKDTLLDWISIVDKDSCFY